MTVRFSRRSLLLWFLGAWGAAGACGYAASEGVSRWETTICAFEERDRTAPPPKRGFLFIGSSSIRGWDLKRFLPDRPAINRGFGGSHVSDSVAFARRIVLPYAPRVIVLYAGDNDIAGKKSPERVCRDFRAFVEIVRESLPTTKIVFVAIKPSLARWKLVDTMRRANALVRAVTEKEKHLAYLDIDAPMCGADGKPRPELFRKDGLHLNAKGYALWTRLLLPHLGETERRGRLWVATCQFPIAGDIAANAGWIRKQMRSAAVRGAHLAHFPECALSGYAGVDHPSLEKLDWGLLRREMTSILALAKELGLWVVLGSTHRLTGGHKPHNALYVISAEGSVVDRYDKRFCTGGDLKHYSPGDHFVIFDVNGVRCGLLICYDIRFPELYRHYHTQGAQLLFHSFYNARQKEGSIHPKIMPPTAQARAATNYLFLSVTNSCAPRSWEGLFVTPDGLIGERLQLDLPGVMINLVDTQKRYYDASRPYRLECIRGKLNSGQVVDDARSRDRTGF